MTNKQDRTKEEEEEGDDLGGSKRRGRLLEEEDARAVDRTDSTYPHSLPGRP